MSGGVSKQKDQGPDRATVARWTAQILSGDFSTIEAAFDRNGLRGPEVIWSPKPGEMITPQLEFLLQYWLGLAEGPKPPRMTLIDPIEMRPALGYVVLVDIVEEGNDLRYRLYGSGIAAITGFDLTGQSVYAHPSLPSTVEFFLATYEAVRLRQTPLYSAYGPRTSKVMARTWQRLTLPLLGENGEVCRFLVGTLPVNRTGTVISKRL